jgi:hypothetical protein
VPSCDVTEALRYAADAEGAATAASPPRVRFLVDQNLSPKIVERLAVAGHDAVHISALGLASASDSRIIAVAVVTDRVV